MSKAKILLILTLALGLFFTSNSSLFSQSEDLDRKRQEIEEIEQQLDRVQGEKQTLSSTINFLDSKISLAQTRIEQTEIELREVKIQIGELSDKIFALDSTLSEVTQLLIHRIGNTYKRSRINPVLTVLASNDLNKIVTRYKYLQNAQKNDRQIMYQMETTRINFDNQKQLKEDKQDELDHLNTELAAQQAILAHQQAEKRALLEITKNDEIRFQNELAKKLAELSAIQSIIAGQGDESEVGPVSSGASIASVIPGPSTCSSGGHLHFEVAENNAHKNPADFLSSKSVVWDNGPDDPFSFSGSWPWPLNDPIRITQGYGHTFFASTLRYYGGAPHTGIDMVNSDDFNVKAVQKGTLFRGAIACRGGSLRYVRVKHSDSQSSYYLHVNY